MKERRYADGCKETVLDVMPLDENILGFSNRFYRPAMGAAVNRELRGGLTVRVVTAPYFLASKIEAFLGRGKGDFLASRDLEDVIFVVDGRATIADEVHAETPSLREYIRIQINELLAKPAFIDALPGYLLPDAASQARIRAVIQRLKKIASD